MVKRDEKYTRKVKTAIRYLKKYFLTPGISK